MEVPHDLDQMFTSLALFGNLELLKGEVKKLKKCKGHQNVQYDKLKTPRGYTALHQAARGGHIEVCRYLIDDLSFDINGTADSSDETPLFLSINEKMEDTAVFLMDNGADVNIPNFLGEAPLQCAAKHGLEVLVRHLVAHGADSNAISVWGLPLHSAAMSGNPDVVKFLLDLKADPNTPPPQGKSALFGSIASGSKECVDLLLKAGANPNHRSYETTPLYFAVAIEKPNLGIIRSLLKAGADPNLLSNGGYTPLDHAALSRQREVVEILFPVTSPIACYKNWTISGIMQYARSGKAIRLFHFMARKEAQLRREKGDEAIANEKYVDGISLYTQAADADPTSPHYADILSKRSLCYTKVNCGILAVFDATICVELRPSSSKAYYREGAALNLLHDYKGAAKAFSRALYYAPGNKEIAAAYMEARAKESKYEHWKNCTHLM